MKVKIRGNKWICEFSDKEMRKIYYCVKSIEDGDAGPGSSSKERRNLISVVRDLLKQHRGIEPWDWLS